jgi:membrane-associated phospholipid phosphatase
MNRPFEFPEEGCSSFKKDNDISDKIEYAKGTGFPSGHSSAAAFSAIYWILQMWHKDIDYKYKILNSAILTLLSFYVINVRLIIKCHKVFQVLSGGLIGTIFGVLSYYLTKYIISYYDEDYYDEYYSEFSIFNQSSFKSVLILIISYVCIVFLLISIYYTMTSETIELI